MVHYGIFWYTIVYCGIYIGFRVSDFGLRGGFILGLHWGYVGKMEKMETTV